MSYKSTSPIFGLSFLILFLLIFSRTIFFNVTGFDDVILINEQQVFLSQVDENNKSISDLFSQDIFPSKKTNDVYFRPLFAFSLLKDQFLGNGSLVYYHIANLIVSILAFFLLYFTLRNYMPKTNKIVLWLSSGLFFLNPLFCSSVCWIPGRNDTLLLVSVLLTMLTFKKVQLTQKPIFGILNVTAFCAAIFIKESAIVIPFLLLLYSLIFCKDFLKSKTLITLSSIWSIMIIIYLILRNNALENPITASYNILGNFITNIISIPNYIGKFFTLSNFSPTPIVPDMNILVSIIGAIILILGIKFTPNKKMALFGISWFVLFLLPGIIFANPILVNSYHFEHRAIVPMIGILFVFIPLLSKLYLKQNNKTLFYIAYSILLLVSSIKTLQYSSSFKNENNFSKAAIESSPNCETAWVLRGSYEYKNKKITDAIKSYKKAISINPTITRNYFNLFKIYYSTNQQKNAFDLIEELKTNKNIDPYTKHKDLAIFYKSINDTAQFEQQYQLAKKHTKDIEQLKKILANVNPANSN